MEQFQVEAAIVGQPGPAAGRKAVVVSSSWNECATNHRLRITAKPTQIAAAQAASGNDAHRAKMRCDCGSGRFAVQGQWHERGETSRAAALEQPHFTHAKPKEEKSPKITSAACSRSGQHAIHPTTHYAALLLLVDCCSLRRPCTTCAPIRWRPCQQPSTPGSWQTLRAEKSNHRPLLVPRSWPSVLVLGTCTHSYIHRSRSHATDLQLLHCYWLSAAAPSRPACALLLGIMAPGVVWQCGSDASS